MKHEEINQKDRGGINRDAGGDYLLPALDSAQIEARVQQIREGIANAGRGAPKKTIPLFPPRPQRITSKEWREYLQFSESVANLRKRVREVEEIFEAKSEGIRKRLLAGAEIENSGRM